MSTRTARPSVGLALVHHANQHIITNGYEDRDGISRICDGYTQLLLLHQRYGMPINLHFSGTLLESIAWHHPEFLDLVKELAADNLLALIGGAYAENIMTLFSPAFNRRQLDELLLLYSEMLDCNARKVKICWVPERVWQTNLLAPVLTDRSLANGGYRYVLLDDRLLFPTNGSYALSPRASFDLAGPYDSPAPASSAPAPASAVDELARPHRIAGGSGLVMVPISANLRYWVPPRIPAHWSLLEEFVGRAAGDQDDVLLLYADDFEKSAGVAGWENTLDQYHSFLRWLAERADQIAPVRLDGWLESHPVEEERSVEAGTFFELAHDWNAGEDYRGWWGSRLWSQYRSDFAIAHEAVGAAEQNGADRRLLALARKHLLASAHETAWQDKREDGDGRAPAPWARAVASHARSCLVMTDAAESFSGHVGPPRAIEMDIDADGEDEIVLSNGRVYAVITPTHGGRLVYLFHRTREGGVLVVGNPTDHWNFQEALNRYMDEPPNHPGALADIGFEHDRYMIDHLEEGPRYAAVRLANMGLGPLSGARKGFLLPASASALFVCYELPAGVERIATAACLSPDYHSLLRTGRRDVRPSGGQCWRGFRNGEVLVWLALPRGDEVAWAEPESPEAGHGLNLCVEGRAPHFDLLLGCGPTNYQRSRDLLNEGSDAMHRIRRTADQPPPVYAAEVEMA
jgi:starch synthase